MRYPNHIAFIMDGNRRLAKKLKISKAFAYRRGALKAIQIINYLSRKKYIKELTFYALSLENLQRDDIFLLFSLLEKYLKRFLHVKSRVKIRFVGDLNKIPSNIRKLAKKIEERHSRGSVLINICLAYSGKWEIIEAVKRCKRLSIEEIERNLYISAPDLIIRTGGYQRLSNFLIWQSAYSELYFVKELWPKFPLGRLKRILKWFKSTKRNFGR